MDLSERILKDHGFNCTKMQIATLNILRQAGHPVSRSDIVQSLKHMNPDKITIYRILERFCEKGIVHKAYTDKRAWEYELADKCTELQCHPHFKCTKCGMVICLHDMDVPLVKGLGPDFIFQRQKIMIEGIGPECSRTLFKR